MRHTNERSSSLIGAMILLGVAAFITPASAEDLTPAEAQTFAKDAYIYGFPIVENYKKMYAYAVAASGEQYKAPFNTLKHEAEVVTPANTAVVTPTADTLYSFPGATAQGRVKQLATEWAEQIGNDAIDVMLLVPV